MSSVFVTEGVGVAFSKPHAPSAFPDSFVQTISSHRRLWESYGEVAATRNAIGVRVCWRLSMSFTRRSSMHSVSCAKESRPLITPYT